MHRSLMVFFALIAFQSVVAQVELTWDDFADINFRTEYSAKYDSYFMAPIFGKKIKTHQGKQIKIKGFFLDITGAGDMYLISANPMASCFFCGAAGPESVIEVVFNELPTFRTDQVVMVSGVLELNDEDVDKCNYILKGATGKLVN